MHEGEVVESTDQSEGLAEAYDKYADPLYKYCTASLGEPAEAADAVQDTFVIAAIRLADLREPDRLRAWLYGVARNECRRIAGPGRAVFASAQEQYVIAGAARVPEDTDHARLRSLLDDATTGLTPAEREVIELEMRQGLPLAEVASVVGVPRTRANALASRCREHLEASLTAVVVARAGRRDCRLLSAMLDGWDGQLTVPLRERLHRHIGRCTVCTTRRDLELHPGRLLGLSPGEALAAAATSSFQVAGGPPGLLKARTLALATEQDPDAIAHRAVVLGRALAFDSQGFPKPAPTAKEAPARGDGSGPAHRRGRTTVAAGLAAAAVIGVVAVALVDGSGHGKQAAGQQAGSAPTTRAPAAAPVGASPGTSPATSSTATPKTSSSPTSTPTSTPTGTPTAANRVTTPAASSSSATAKPTATGTASKPTPTPTPTAKASPGTLVISPSGGTLMDGTTRISITAQGGAVTWSSTVSSGLGSVHLSPSGGTIAKGGTVTATLTASGAAGGRQVTINPGGTVFTIFGL
jgi:RNA polymerase sigma factor (sigma-70 family)